MTAGFGLRAGWSGSDDPRARGGEPPVKTVLVVDDDTDILSLVSFVLEAEGYRVELACHGREALAVVARRLPDLILLDMKMPVLNGWEFAREFRACYGDPVPIVVLTAAEDAGRRAAEIGADDWLSKPFDLDVLVQVVNRHLGARFTERAPGRSNGTVAG